MSSVSTLMETETREVPQIIAKQLRDNERVMAELCERIYKVNPAFAITIGRGSSDHACTYAKYLLEVKAGLITASAAPSIVTVYNSDLHLQRSLVIGISQSGQSPDICKMMQVARDKDAITMAIVNDVDSPLARIAEFVIPMHAGKEQAVAATKSYLASLAALVHFIAVLKNDVVLLEKLKELPSILQYLLDKDHSDVINVLLKINNTFVIGRGFGFPIAQEIALKFKETAGIQAEAFSAAEILHGPFALIKSEHPYILLAQNDATLPSILELAEKIKLLGGKVIFAIPSIAGLENQIQQLSFLTLPLPVSLDPVLDPLMLLQAFYPLIAKIAVARGFNPDAPDNLKKVTETL